MRVSEIWKSRLLTLFVIAIMIPAISGCTTLDEDELDGSSENSYGQGEIISAEPHKGSAD